MFYKVGIGCSNNRIMMCRALLVYTFSSFFSGTLVVYKLFTTLFNAIKPLYRSFNVVSIFYLFTIMLFSFNLIGAQGKQESRSMAKGEKPATVKTRQGDRPLQFPDKVLVLIADLGGFSVNELRQAGGSGGGSEPLEGGAGGFRFLYLKSLLYQPELDGAAEGYYRLLLNKNRAWSVYLPSASLFYNQRLIDSRGLGSASQLYLRLKQPIFGGFSLIDTGAISRKEALIGKLDLESAIRLTLEQFSTLYYEYTLVSRLLQLQERTVDLTRKRLSYLQERRRLGRSRESEVLAAETSLQRLEGEKGGLKARHLTLFKELQSITGMLDLSGEKGEGGLVDLPETGGGYNDSWIVYENYDSVDVTLALMSRSDILAAREEVVRQKLLMRSVWGAVLPSVYLQGDLYFAGQPGYYSTTGSSGGYSLYGVVEFSLSPAATLTSRVNEQRSQIREAQKKEGVLIERAILAVEDLRARCQLTHQQYLSYRKAFALAKERYKVVQKEYGYGRVDNLEVLSALIEMQQTETLLAGAEADLRTLQYWYLLSLNIKPAKVIATLEKQ